MEDAATFGPAVEIAAAHRRGSNSTSRSSSGGSSNSSSRSSSSSSSSSGGSSSSSSSSSSSVRGRERVHDRSIGEDVFEFSRVRTRHRSQYPP